jgi:hypothetical protein
LSFWAITPVRARVLLVSSLAGIIAGAAAGAASAVLEGFTGLAAAALYLAGLAAAVAPLRGLGTARILEGALAYTALFIGFWVGVYDAIAY